MRAEAWTHAGDVLTIPKFLPLSYLVRHCYIVERILMNYEDSQKVDDHGVTRMVNAEEIVALADYWILGFFDILRIVMSGEYKEVAEFPVAQCFRELKKKTAYVRNAFTKLRPPGHSQLIVPLRWPRLVGQLGGLFKVYSDCHSYRQNLLGQIFLSLLLRL